MVAPPSLVELLSMRKLDKYSVERQKQMEQKRKQLLEANKLTARSLLLGVSGISIEKVVQSK